MTAAPAARRRFTVKLLARECPCDGTIALRLAKPAGLTFRPGQYLDLSLPAPPGGEPPGAARSFSIASAPYEETLLLATRAGPSRFKQALARAAAGASLEIEGPAGIFTLDQVPAGTVVFVAGGIGITPFRSMIRQAAYENWPRMIRLFYGNHQPSRAAFLAELRQFARDTGRFRFVPVFQDTAGDRDGVTGRITSELLAKFLPPLRDQRYYIAGPPEMVGAVRQELNAAGVDDDVIQTEEFSGY